MASFRAARFGRKVCVSFRPPDDVIPMATDAVLIIDTSGSMSYPANDALEMRAFTKLDLAKHAAEIFARGMSERDTLTVIAFNDDVERVLPRTAMDAAGKNAAALRIGGLVAGGGTALWSALRAGLETAAANDRSIDANASAHSVVVILTDGQPSTSPPAGEEATLIAYRTEMRNACRVITVGLGNDVNSALLAALGSIVFISDGSMVINIFTHLLANEQTVYAKHATLRIENDGIPSFSTAWGPLHVGQRRDAMFELPSTVAVGDVEVRLELSNGASHTIRPTEDDAFSQEFASEVARHEALNAMRQALRIGNVNLDAARDIIGKASVRLQGVLAPEIDDDLMGQVAMALQPGSWMTWGPHFLRALLAAHDAQTCNNLKDPGLQPYAGAPFRARLAALAVVCDAMPPPKPFDSQAAATMTTAQFSRLFVTAEGGCFGPAGFVLLENGSSRRVDELAPGDLVATVDANAVIVSARVACVVEMRGAAKTVRVRGVEITPSHPVRVHPFSASSSSTGWAHATDLTVANQAVAVAPVIYNIVLIGATGACGSLFFVSSQGQPLFEACTLGHGLKGAVIEHAYLGTDRVVNDLMRFPGWAEGRIIMSERNVVRDADGHVCRYSHFVDGNENSPGVCCVHKAPVLVEV